MWSIACIVMLQAVTKMQFVLVVSYARKRSGKEIAKGQVMY